MSGFQDEIKVAIQRGGNVDDERVRRIRLLLLDRETGEERYCTLEEAENWDWANPELWRICNGWQITSFDTLVNLLSMKAEKGVEEIEILQSPRFMMLAGG
jgi:hypothetical protein